jgi:phosphopantothenoylcysteine decarboxylase/phosphopantothenate--cysteine ligase
MDLDMYDHPSTKRNLEILKNDGNIIIEPVTGELASGLHGKGRMEEPEMIVKLIKEIFEERKTKIPKKKRPAKG